MKTTPAVKKMSDIVLQCEHRAAWSDLFESLRHGTAFSKHASNRAAMLEQELRGRGVASLFDNNSLQTVNHK